MRLGEAHLFPYLRTCALAAGSQKIYKLFFFFDAKMSAKEKKKSSQLCPELCAPPLHALWIGEARHPPLGDKHLEKKVYAMGKQSRQASRAPETARSPGPITLKGQELDSKCDCLLIIPQDNLNQYNPPESYSCSPG